MLLAEIKKIGKAEDSIKIENVDFSDSISDTQILIEIILFPINPADILLVEGHYANMPKLPSKLGAECIASVIKVGSKISKFKVGDLVLPLSRNNWVQRKKVNEDELIKLSINTNILQSSMLKINPATAYLMLNNYTSLKQGDYIIQNAANSGVGYYVIQLCKYYKINTINIVRRKELHNQLLKIGADEVFTYDDLNILIEKLKSKNIKLFLDAVGGKGVEQIAFLLANNASIINYGLLSNESIKISSHELIFRNLSIKGFWLSKWLEKMPVREKVNLYKHLEELINQKKLYTKIQKIYDIRDISDALRTSKQNSRNGKILVSPNLQKYKRIFTNYLN